MTCRKISNKIHRLPCKRWKLTDVKLFKPGQVKGYEWTRRWNDSTSGPDIGNWENHEIKTIKVTEGYTGQYVELRVRKFRPHPTDKLERTWVETTSTGKLKRSVRIPKYAIMDLEAAKKSYEAYVEKGLQACCEKLLGPREKLLWRTYELAMWRARTPETSKEERDLIKSTLDLWMTIRLTTKSCEIVGDEKLGMPNDILGPNMSEQGGVPLPPVMGAQIDAILLNNSLPRLRRETLEMLQAMTSKKQQRTWLTTYLVTFILLHNVALITKHDWAYARKHGMEVRISDASCSVRCGPDC